MVAKSANSSQFYPDAIMCTGPAMKKITIILELKPLTLVTFELQIVVPAASMASADSLPLMHAHTYPDLMSFGDAAFPSVSHPAGQNQIYLSSQTQMPQTNPQQLPQGSSHHAAQHRVAAKPVHNASRYCLCFLCSISEVNVHNQKIILLYHCHKLEHMHCI